MHRDKFIEFIDFDGNITTTTVHRWDGKALDRRADVERVYTELQLLRARAALQAPDN